MFEKYYYLIEAAINRIGVPKYLKDDCRQAGAIGLLKGIKSIEGAKNPECYMFICIKNEILRELANMQGPGHLPISLKINTFLAYNKYKAGNSENVSNQNKKAFDRLLDTPHIKQLN